MTVTFSSDVHLGCIWEGLKGTNVASSDRSMGFSKTSSDLRDDRCPL